MGSATREALAGSRGRARRSSAAPSSPSPRTSSPPAGSSASPRTCARALIDTEADVAQKRALVEAVFGSRSRPRPPRSS